MIKFYTSHCPQCKVLKMTMDRKNIEYEEIDDESVYLDIAKENNIMSMPFAELEGKVLNTKELRDYIMTKENK